MRATEKGLLDGLDVIEELLRVLLFCVTILVAGAAAWSNCVLAKTFCACPTARAPHPPSVMATDAVMISAFMPVALFEAPALRLTGFV